MASLLFADGLGAAAWVGRALRRALRCSDDRAEAAPDLCLGGGAWAVVAASPAQAPSGSSVARPPTPRPAGAGLLLKVARNSRSTLSVAAELYPSSVSWARTSASYSADGCATIIDQCG